MNIKIRKVTKGKYEIRIESLNLWGSAELITDSVLGHRWRYEFVLPNSEITNRLTEDIMKDLAVRLANLENSDG
jgi:hypothetical protein